MLKRATLVILGLFFTLLAAVGAVLPGLPTTPFLIIAIVCFANSSKTLHAWLERLPLFRSAIKHAHLFLEHRTVTLRVKIISLTCAWAAFFFTFYGARFLWTPPAIIVLCCAIAATAAMLITKTAK